MPKAQPSTRVLNSVTMTCALVNIPISIYTGTVSDEPVKRHQYLPVEVPAGKKKTKTELHPVGMAPYDKETKELLDEAAKKQVVKLVATEYGDVFVEDHEVEQKLGLDPDTLNITAFQPLALLTQGHHYVPKKVMYVEPPRVGNGKKTPGKNAGRALAALLQEMRERGVMAVCELTTRGKPKPCILMPDGALYEVWHTNALREQRELEEIEIPADRRAMIGTLIDSYLTTDPVDLEDKKSELILAFAQEKAEAGDFTVPEGDTYVAPSVADDIEDDSFFRALQDSIKVSEKATAKATKKAAS